MIEGDGYDLSIVFHPGKESQLPDVTKIIQRSVPDYKLFHSADLKATYNLPQESIKK